MGAGFSKAVADLPLTKDMFDSFESVLKIQKELGVNSSHIKRGEALFEELDDLQNKLLIFPYLNLMNGEKEITPKNWRSNFEGICSYIDLNLAYQISSCTKDKHGEIGDLTTPPFELCKTSLQDFRRNISFYLYLTLINKKGDTVLLNKFYENFLNDNSSIISFNYDLVMESFLFEQGKWFPSDGYGIPFNIKGKSFSRSSEIQIFKMHGSLNWIDKDGNLELVWNDTSIPHKFPDYPTDDFNIYFTAGTWMLPSFIKQFSIPKILEIWSRAAKQLTVAEEVLFIGYRLPPEDSAVYALLSNIDFTNKTITVINPDKEIDALKENYSRALRLSSSKIEFISKPLQEVWL
ncbi:MAG: Uncharacterized protein FD122_1157 [Stygiobacter sp.]|nr:MAG: Uncharacterized protein FD122_1157 [Stygiobacter sp.]KAF0218263.1 MAG: hypothetical protein FD178_143 [Ignavibacteria bacterium]